MNDCHLLEVKDPFEFLDLAVSPEDGVETVASHYVSDSSHWHWSAAGADIGQPIAVDWADTATLCQTTVAWAVPEGLGVAEMERGPCQAVPIAHHMSPAVPYRAQTHLVSYDPPWGKRAKAQQ